MNLSTLSVAASRLSQRMSEEVGELGLLDALTASSHVRYWDVGEPAMKETGRLLDAKTDKEKLEGVKRVLALMSLRGPKASLPFFPSILRSLSPQNSLMSSNTSRSLHRLSSLYIIRHARLAPDLALLCVNSFQKDLGDSDPLRRATAVRVLSSMVGEAGVEGLDGLLGVILSRASRDASWYVRREAALALVDVYPNAPSLVSTLREVLPSLLASRSALAIPAALHAYETLYPYGKTDLIHPHYKRYCRLLLDSEPWGQTICLRVLAAYARSEFRDPNQYADPDLDLLLKSAEALLLSSNAAVALCSVKILYLLSPSNRLPIISRTLLRLLNSSEEILRLVLTDTAVIAKERPELLSEYISEYFIRSTDKEGFKALKLDILMSLTTSSNIQTIMSELNEYLLDLEISDLAIQALGTVALKLPSVLDTCINTLIRLCASSNENTVSQSVLVIQRLLSSSPKNTNSELIARLAFLLINDKIKIPAARANVLWLIGVHAQAPEVMEHVAIDVARLSVKRFVTEGLPARLQILTLVARLLVLAKTSQSKHTRPLSLLFHYVSSLARYDLVYEVRDRARFLKGLLDSAGMTMTQSQLATLEEPSEFDLQAFARGETIQKDEPFEFTEHAFKSQDVIEILFAAGRETYQQHVETGRQHGQSIDTFYILTGKTLQACSPISPWRTTPPEPSLRQETESPTPPSPLGSVSSRTITPTGFGSDSFMGKKQRGSASSPVVLTPIDTPKATSSTRGFRNIQDFLGDEDSGEEEEDEEEEEEEEEEDDDDDDDDDDDEEDGEGEEEITKDN